MSTPHDNRERNLIAEQAAQWACDLREAGPERQARFLSWLKRSPQHVREYLFSATLWRETRQIALEDDADLERLTAEVLSGGGDANVVTLEDRQSLSQVDEHRNARRAGYGRRWAVAAGLAVLCTAGALTAWLVSGAGDADTYHTAIGEQRAVRLSDGSVLHLNTRSRVQVRFSATGRDLRLQEGEVLFTVAPDADRPFRVRAGETLVQALGTQFNIYRREAAQGAETRVAVLEGAIKLTSGMQRTVKPAADDARIGAGTADDAVLAAGEAARIASDGRIVKQSEIDLSIAMAWRERRLVFQGETLQNVAAEFNRYNPRLIRVEGAAARNKLLSATFNADDPQSLVLFLRRLDDLSVESSPEEIVVRQR